MHGGVILHGGVIGISGIKAGNVYDASPPVERMNLKVGQRSLAALIDEESTMMRAKLSDPRLPWALAATGSLHVLSP